MKLKRKTLKDVGTNSCVIRYSKTGRFAPLFIALRSKLPELHEYFMNSKKDDYSFLFMLKLALIRLDGEMYRDISKMDTYNSKLIDIEIGKYYTAVLLSLHMQ